MSLWNSREESWEVELYLLSRQRIRERIQSSNSENHLFLVMKGTSTIDLKCLVMDKVTSQVQGKGLDPKFQFMISKTKVMRNNTLIISSFRD